MTNRLRTTRHTPGRWAVIVTAGAVALSGCSGSSGEQKPSGGSGGTATTGAASSSRSGAPARSSAAAERSTATPGLPTQAELDQAKKDVSKLTTKQLAGQVIVGFYSGADAASAADAVRKDGLGGVILMGDNVPTDVTRGMPAITSGVQKAMGETGRDWPAVIGIDQEGGPVARIKAPVTQLPGGMAYGAADDEKLAARVARDQGQELRALGVTMVFAPDADVTVGPQDPTIGVRSPGSDPARVARAVNGQVEGFSEAGLVPVIKHFPGHGSVTTDTHVDYAVQPQPVSALTKRDWVPFASAVKAGAPAVMTAHIVLKDVDPNVPSTLSPKVLTGQLRDKLGFKGLVITDGMNMGAIVKNFDQGGAAAVSALKAGADVVLMPANASASVAAIERAVAQGGLTRERLIDSAARIVATTRHQQVATPPVSVVGSHERDAITLARESITQLGGTCGKPLVGKRVRLDGGAPSDRAELKRALAARGVGVGASDTRVSLISGGSYNAGKSSAGGGAEANSAGGAGAGTSTSAGVQVALDTPYALASRPAGAVGLAAYGNTPATFAALADILTAKAKPGGTLPVTVGGEKVGASACS